MTVPFRFGIGMRGDLTRGEYGRYGALAEELGFDVVTVFADLGYEPPFQPLLEVAHATRRVRLGPACLNPYTTHPVEIAGQVAALDAASHGRAYAGLARGAWLASIGVAQPRPLTALREAAQVVRLLLAGDLSGFAGEVFALEPGFRLRHAIPHRRVPLLIGAWGEQTVTLAGRIADELKVGGSANPDLVPLMRARLAAGSRLAGRETPGAGLVMGAVTVVDEDGAAARECARSAVAMYFDVVAALDPTVQVPAELLREISRCVAMGDDRAAGRLIPDELLDRFAFCGTPAEVSRHVRQIVDAGAARIEFGAPFGLEQGRGLRLLGERVLPEFL